LLTKKGEQGTNALFTTVLAPLQFLKALETMAKGGTTQNKWHWRVGYMESNLLRCA